MRYRSFLTVVLSASFVIMVNSNEEKVGTNIPFTAEDIDLVVSLHNQVRALNMTPIASDMRTMYWDEDLAKFARKWTDNCHYKPMENTTTDLWSEVGQSYLIAAAAWSEDYHYTAVLRWLEQKDTFTYQDGSCTDFCGEFLQLSFSDTFKIGCSATLCTILETAAGEAYEDATLYMCTYYPKAPFNPGYQPYKAGPACTNCSNSDDTCTDFKLCTNPERQVTMLELKKRAAKSQDSATKGSGWSLMHTIISAVTGGIGMIAAVGAILKLCKSSPVSPTQPPNQSAAEVPADPPAGQQEAPADEEQPEERAITNGKAPTIPIDAPES